ncbi:hypothetical protein FN846DRAFT_910748 [Sphaerosporella brunnea]|uniref:Uncharacterized protein n=1 Tax=Sphaerosporella brunnea TaxID=1250544 RepID=A0A5J5ELQ0_9PEZI|nr:hypothetical protein FN846DRAFT_910748 [Sphaerosporella brunnea]
MSGFLRTLPKPGSRRCTEGATHEAAAGHTKPQKEERLVVEIRTARASVEAQGGRICINEAKKKDEAANLNFETQISRDRTHCSRRSLVVAVMSTFAQERQPPPPPAASPP